MIVKVKVMNIKGSTVYSILEEIDPDTLTTQDNFGMDLNGYKRIEIESNNPKFYYTELSWIIRYEI